MVTTINSLTFLQMLVQKKFVLQKQSQANMIGIFAIRLKVGKNNKECYIFDYTTTHIDGMHNGPNCEQK
jgi:hypothetical protein